MNNSEIENNMEQVKNRWNLSFQTSIINIVFLFLILLLTLNTQAQTGSKKWKASWITVPGISETDYGVYLFRKNFDLADVPDSFMVYVSADNQYKLFVNGKQVSFGPAKSDVEHWNYEKVDLLPYLKNGKNSIAAKVWNDGPLKAEIQMSLKTGFILQGVNKESEIINTDESWKCTQDKSYTPIRIGAYGMGEVNVRGYYVAGPGEKIDMHNKIQNWNSVSFDDSHWQNAKNVFQSRRGLSSMATAEKSWTLVPSILPPMETTCQRLIKTRLSEGVTTPASFPAEKAPVQVPASTKARILLDQTFLTTAFPTLVISGGNNSTINLTYAEALYDGNAKGNRNEVKGKTMIGTRDVVISDGSNSQEFTSLSYRTYRYVELTVETKEEPLVIDDFYGTFTGYPFQLNAKLETDITFIQKIFETGWRSARLCAHDTYMDTPFYERLQYIGDTRIQAMVSLYNSGDDRLVKNALNLMDYSRQRDGVTLSRYPTGSENQIIPPFSLFYIGMLHDYMMYGPDPGFIKNKLPGMRQVLNYFAGLQDKDGSLKNVPDWNFTDWAQGWVRGVPPTGKDGSSALLDLQLLMGLQAAVELEQNLGRTEFSGLYLQMSDQLAKTIQKKYWDKTRGLFSDTPEKDKFSQHTNSLAILTGLVKDEDANKLGRLIISDSTLTQASIYFKYYLHQALVKAGLGDDYLKWLEIWRKNIDLDLTTWGEDSKVENTRSDCHAWGASPNIEFFRTILGINSDGVGFSKVRIKPHLGNLPKIAGEMPHPQGKISTRYQLEKKKWNIEIILPGNVTGTFVLKGNTLTLKPGKNTFEL